MKLGISNAAGILHLSEYLGMKDLSKHVRYYIRVGLLRLQEKLEVEEDINEKSKDNKTKLLMTYYRNAENW